jgi:hypothetical protein
VGDKKYIQLLGGETPRKAIYRKTEKHCGVTTGGRWILESCPITGFGVRSIAFSRFTELFVWVWIKVKYSYCDT